MQKRPMFDERLVERLEYDIDYQSNKMLDKLVIHPIEVGNAVEFKSKKDANASFSIPINKIIALNLPQQKKGLLTKEDVLLEIEFYDSTDNKSSISFNIKDVYVQQILDQVKTLQKVEQEYWDTADLQYILDGMPKTTKLYYRAPFLSEGEELLWINTKIEGTANKHMRWLEALTNFRAIYYDFTKHECGRIPLNFVDDVIVKNKKLSSGSDRVGTFTGSMLATSSGSSGTIGDVVFMRNGKPTVTFLQVSDPNDIATLANIVIEEFFKPLKAGKKTQLPLIEGSVIKLKTSKTGEIVCPYCSTANQTGSAFCNNCGFALR